MSDETPFGSGGHGRSFPEIDPELKRQVMDSFNHSTSFFPAHLGVKVADLRRGYYRREVETRPQLMRAGGVMHGGGSFGLADPAVAVALFTIYPFGTMLLTIEMKINYLEPILPGLVTAEAYVLRSSKG